MGNCEGISEIDNYQYRQIKANQINNRKHNTSFKDFPEYKNGTTIGNGIHTIPSYKCTIAYDQLNRLREEFWNSKTTYTRVWAVIKECCNTDSETAIMLLEAAEMACKGDLRQVFILAQPDLVFTVPNFCICDPCFERDYNVYQSKANVIQEQPLTLILYYLALNKNINFKVTNKTLGKDVKRLFANQMKIKMNSNVIRLLFKGQEIKEEHMLYYHNVENGSKIQVMVRPKEM